MTARGAFLSGVLIFLLSSACGESDGPRTASEASAVPDTAAAPAPSVDVDQTVYVPVYSHIFSRSERRRFNLTTTLSVRNADTSGSIVVEFADYYDSDGQLVHRYLESPRTLRPLGSLSVVVEEDDTRGGAGANFLVGWHASQPVNEPIIEAVMISTASANGISFLSRGVPINDRRQQTE